MEELSLLTFVIGQTEDLVLHNYRTYHIPFCIQNGKLLPCKLAATTTTSEQRLVIGTVA